MDAQIYGILNSVCLEFVNQILKQHLIQTVNLNNKKVWQEKTRNNKKI